jgi:hypothetical protein
MIIIVLMMLTATTSASCRFSLELYIPYIPGIMVADHPFFSLDTTTTVGQTEIFQIKNVPLTMFAVHPVLAL